ncbi:dynein heavy chain 9, axonemal-like [Lacerta agilis]|uniref:dynein heavy chain 9, axonemal-like n=1 Tax=Lacerta agilis TaxID=80427 RepID=UPI0014196533|nr:dynein heavy chain 9, axonemal-like [Lacerta agilis]
MGGEEPEPDFESAPETDPRARLLGARVASSLRVEPERWERCAGSPEARPLLRAFLDGDPAKRLLLVTPGAGGQLALADRLALAPGTGRSGKGVFLLRLTPGPLRSPPAPGHLLYGDLCSAPLEHLAALVEEVVVPLLGNQKNHPSWPHVVSQDIVHHICNLKSSVFVVVGQIKGKTLLPLPTDPERDAYIDSDNEKNTELVDKSIVHAIESAVIEWTHQIQGVLKRESSEPLLQGQDPSPKVELDFWKSRFEDLQCIYSQLKARRVLTMMELLDRVQSTYFPAFRSIFRDVEAALVEAHDINVHLKPLEHPLEEIENVEFNELKPLLNRVLHVVCLIWATSKYYSTPARIIVLLQEICSLLIQQARTYLNGEDLLKAETEESLGKVQTTFDIFNYFKQTFEERRDNLSTYFQPGLEAKEWDFPSVMVFARLDNFLERLHVVNDLLVTALDIEKLEKLEFSGIKGKSLSQQVLSMYEEFQEVYKVFSDRTYDCLDVANMEFEDDVYDFKEKVEDMDRRLGTAFAQAFDDAASIEHAFKLIDIFGSLLERPLIAADAYAKYHLLITMFDRDLDDAKLIYLKHIQEELELGCPTVHRNMPLVAGGIRWAQELKDRIQIPFSNFRHATHLCLDSAEGKRMVQKYEDLMEMLENWCQFCEK